MSYNRALIWFVLEGLVISVVFRVLIAGLVCSIPFFKREAAL